MPVIASGNLYVTLYDLRISTSFVLTTNILFNGEISKILFYNNAYFYRYLVCSYINNEDEQLRVITLLIIHKYYNSRLKTRMLLKYYQ